MKCTQVYFIYSLYICTQLYYSTFSLSLIEFFIIIFFFSLIYFSGLKCYCDICTETNHTCETDGYCFASTSLENDVTTYAKR